MHLTLLAQQPFVLSSVLGSHGWIRLAPNGTDDALSLLTRVEGLDVRLRGRDPRSRRRRAALA